MNKANCLSLIRLLAAIQVFLGHAVTHLQIKIPTIFMEFLGVFQGVPIFFVISGFLIWNSLNKESDLKIFAQKRILRLYPEMWGGVLLSVLSILLLYGSRINWKTFLIWICAQATLLQFWTPQCLRNFGCGTPNGSLWTIGVMVQAYIVIWILYKILHKRRHFRWIIVLIVGIGCNVLFSYSNIFMPALISKLFKQTFIPYIWMFVVGAMICEFFMSWKEYIVKYWWCFFIASAFFSISKWDIGMYGTIKVTLLALAIIGFAYKFPRFNIKYDFSYGLYIYHMIIINVFIELGYVGKILDLVIVFILSVVLASISYITIGKIYRKKKHIMELGNFKKD